MSCFQDERSRLIVLQCPSISFENTALNYATKRDYNAYIHHFSNKGELTQSENMMAMIWTTSCTNFIANNLSLDRYISLQPFYDGLFLYGHFIRFLHQIAGGHQKCSTRCNFLQNLLLSTPAKLHSRNLKILDDCSSTSMS